MLSTYAALVAGCALQAGVTRYVASAYLEARSLATVENERTTTTTSLEADPRLELMYEEPTFDLGVAYFPRLLTALPADAWQFLNRGSLTSRIRATPTLVVPAAASASYGTYDFRLQNPAAGPVQPVPSAPTVKYMSGSVSVGLESRSSERFRTGGVLSYLVEGGADAPARSTLPLHRGPTFSASLAWTASRDDVLTTALTGSYYAFLAGAVAPGAFVPRANAWTSQVLESWQHALGPQSTLRLAAGIGAAGNAIDFPRLVLRRALPVAEAGFQQGFVLSGRPGLEGGRRPAEAETPTPVLQLNVGARVGPFVDFTTGLAYERADASASFGWPVHRDWRLEAAFSAGIVMEGDQHGQVTGTGQLTTIWAATPWAQISAGLGGLWQRAGPDFPASTFRQWSVFLGATFRQGGQL
jgi:hypothetical protein